MSFDKNLVKRSNHRDGLELWSGHGHAPHQPQLESFLRDFPLEHDRNLRYRSWVLSPANYGIPHQETTTQPLFGDGLKIGTNTAGANMDVNLSGAQGDGDFHMRTTGGATDACFITGPNDFKAEAGTVLKFHCKMKIEDVSESDVLVGLGTDNSDAANNPPEHIVLATGEPGNDFTDGIIFHRLAGDATTHLELSVFDGGSNANSVTALVLPAALPDNEHFELGFQVNGLTSIDVFMLVQGVFKSQRITRVSGSVLDLLTASLQRLGMVAGVCTSTASSATTSEAIMFRSAAIVQTFA